MWRTVREVFSGAWGDFRCAWSSLAVADIAYKAIAFAVLTPALTLFMRWMLSVTTGRVIADADIARFFVTTPRGLIAIILAGALVITITFLEMACLMAVGLAASRGVRMRPRTAFAFGAARTPWVLALAGHMVLRVVGYVAPFLLAFGLVYLGLLRGHDINYYLAQRPPEFWVAAGIGGVLGVALAALLVRAVTRWALALPIVLFEKMRPIRALGASAKRSVGHRLAIAGALALWLIVSVALVAGHGALMEFLGRSLAPHFSSSLAPLLAIMAGLAILWAVLGLVVSVVSGALLALVLVRLYLHVGEPREPLAFDAAAEVAPEVGRRLSRAVAVAVGVFGVLVALGVILVAVRVAQTDRPVLVIAHRGASLAAPENSLSAFRLAAEEGADFVELDVQESLDGEVMVVHDSDLMKTGGAPMKIWEATAEQLRAVDIGSRVGAEFANERVPTLAEALAVCKGKARVLIELKSYGHDEKLEERVIGVVEAAGMVDECTYMSMDHDMVRMLKRLRPSWRVGVLAAKALGDITKLNADFLAVATSMANRRFVRRAHRSGQDVYVWTVDDPAWMLKTMSDGVDGLITNRPALARKVVERHAQMSDAQRVLVAWLIRSGARAESLAAESALRP